MTTDIMENKQRPARVLLVEDNNGDIILTRRAFRESRIANELDVVTSGEDALSYLKQEGEYAKVGTPDLILLDLNLPQMSGQEVLSFIKEEKALRHIPVIILSSSSAEQDVVKSYNLHANGYVIKPMNLEAFKEVVSTLERFWFTLVVLPDAADVARIAP